VGPYTTSTPIASTLTDFTGFLNFQQFNSSLGTLTAVELQFSSTLTTTLDVTNGANSSSHGTAKTELQVTIEDVGSNLNVPELDIISSAYAYTLNPGGSVQSGQLTKSGSSDDTYTIQAILNEFTGGGQIVLNVSTLTQTLLANTGGNTSASQVTYASLTGDVIYYYELPEPSTFGMMGAALVGLAGLRFRKRATS
jgi:hypothetical protein